MLYQQDQPRSGAFWASSFIRWAETTFWIAFIILPILTGWLVYDWLPNESFDGRIHEVLQTEVIDTPDGGTGERVEVWRDKKTGREYSRFDFAHHRRAEARRMAGVWFIYGLVGCFVFAAIRSAKKTGSIYDAFGKAILLNLVVAGYIWLKSIQ
jgi:hypothetical protein